MIHARFLLLPAPVPQHHLLSTAVPLQLSPTSFTTASSTSPSATAWAALSSGEMPPDPHGSFCISLCSEGILSLSVCSSTAPHWRALPTCLWHSVSLQCSPPSWSTDACSATRLHPGDARCQAALPLLTNLALSRLRDWLGSPPAACRDKTCSAAAHHLPNAAPLLCSESHTCLASAALPCRWCVSVSAAWMRCMAAPPGAQAPLLAGMAAASQAPLNCSSLSTRQVQQPPSCSLPQRAASRCLLPRHRH